MSKLTSDRVLETMKACLFEDGESIDAAIKADGIVNTFAFHPKRIEEQKAVIKEMLDELPDSFKEGMSFLNACITKDGDHWGEHRNMAQLFALGQAAGYVKLLMPRALWQCLPGGMPYFIVNTEDKATA